MQEVMDKPTTQPIVFVILVGGGFAVWNAYWNDGLLLSWLLLSSLITPWLMQYNLQFGIYHPAVSAGYVTLALIVGTVGYLIGVGVRRVARGDTEGGFATSFTAMFGSTVDRPSRWYLLVSGLFVISAGLVYVAVPYRSLLLSIVYPFMLFYPVGHITGRMILGVGLIGGWIGAAAWPAYRGNGLLISWSLLFAPMFGVTLSYSLLGPLFTNDTTSSVVDDVLIAALLAVAISVILGALGFVIGVLIRRAVATWPQGHEKTGV